MTIASPGLEIRNIDYLKTEKYFLCRKTKTNFPTKAKSQLITSFSYI